MNDAYQATLNKAFERITNFKCIMLTSQIVFECVFSNKSLYKSIIQYMIDRYCDEYHEVYNIGSGLNQVSATITTKHGHVKLTFERDELIVSIGWLTRYAKKLVVRYDDIEFADKLDLFISGM